MTTMAQNGSFPAETVELGVLHHISGRMRLGQPFLELVRGDPRYLEPALGHCPAVRAVSTNPITRTTLVRYDPAEVAPVTLLKRAALATQLRVLPRAVRVPALERGPVSRLSPAQLASGGLLLLGLARAVVQGWSNAPHLVDGLAAAATGYAVLEKGLRELSKGGSLAPDSLSFVYLLSTVRAGNPLPAALFAWLVNFGKLLVERRDPADFTLEDGEFCKGCLREGGCTAMTAVAPLNKIARQQEPLTRTLPAVVILAAVAALWPRFGRNGSTTAFISGIEEASQEQQAFAGRLQLLGQLVPFMQM
jgi:hypothetical protein